MLKVGGIVGTINYMVNSEVDEKNDGPDTKFLQRDRSDVVRVDHPLATHLSLR